MKIIAIVAASENNVIGVDNTMPWHLPDDFKFFKKHTLGSPILMGRNTWTSLGRALPGRDNIIISSQLNDVNIPNVYIYKDVATALQVYRDKGTSSLYIIGGGAMYEQTIHMCDEILLTRIHTNIENGQVFFPEIRENKEWILAETLYHAKDEKHFSDFTFQRWIKSIF